MKIIVSNADPSSPKILTSRRLAAALGFTTKKTYALVHMTRLKSTHTFALVPMSEEEARQAQCSMLLRTEKRQYPAAAYFTVPSFQQFCAITGLTVIRSVVLKVKPVQAGTRTIYVIQNK